MEGFCRERGEILLERDPANAAAEDAFLTAIAVLTCAQLSIGARTAYPLKKA